MLEVFAFVLLCVGSVLLLFGSLVILGPAAASLGKHLEDRVDNFFKKRG